MFLFGQMSNVRYVTGGSRHYDAQTRPMMEPGGNIAMSHRRTSVIIYKAKIQSQNEDEHEIILNYHQWTHSKQNTFENVPKA